MIKKGDNVYVVTGKERGKTGRVLKVIREIGRVVVEGVNVHKKHMRPKKQGQKGEIVSVSRSMNVSNVMIVCSKCGQRTRMGHTMTGDTKTRTCKKCKGEV
ncbi:MAG: 50S ribosomal protein L24 [Parcubacteria group bacterium]|nr:50S ribosomal protein L24 [Parcubacteria group bacterium]